MEKNSSRNFMPRFLRLLIGLVIYAFGIVITLRANIGYAPWDVFHSGLSKTLGISFGTASIAVGIAVAVITVLLGEKIGLGTILNMVLIGLMIDIILYIDILPLCGGLITGIPTLITGLFIIAFATYFYIGSGFGAGPRDSLMVALTRKTHLPVGVCRGAAELSALSAGWLLGGMVGVGTVLSALSIGFCVQITFKLLRFEPTAIEHQNLSQTYNELFGKTESKEASNGSGSSDSSGDAN